jgi:hypothetical protein
MELILELIDELSHWSDGLLDYWSDGL